MTNIFEVGIKVDTGDFVIYHENSRLLFKNLNDAQQYQTLIGRLQQKKSLPEKYGDFQLQPYLKEVFFYTINELVFSDLKRSYILAKLDEEDKQELGIS